MGDYIKDFIKEAWPAAVFGFLVTTVVILLMVVDDQNDRIRELENKMEMVEFIQEARDE